MRLHRSTPARKWQAHKVTVQLVPVGGIPLIRPGADLVEVIWNACDSTGNRLRDGDVLAITGKIVSKSEGRFVDLRTVEPSDRAHRLARLTDKDPASSSSYSANLSRSYGPARGTSSSATASATCPPLPASTDPTSTVTTTPPSSSQPTPTTRPR